MPKSKHRSKRSFQPIKKIDTAQPAGTPVMQAATAPASRPAPSAGAQAPLGVHHPYVFSELKRISLLTGIILVILIACALFLPRTF